MLWSPSSFPVWSGSGSSVNRASAEPNQGLAHPCKAAGTQSAGPGFHTNSQPGQRQLSQILLHSPGTRDPFQHLQAPAGHSTQEAAADTLPPPQTIASDANVAPHTGKVSKRTGQSRATEATAPSMDSSLENTACPPRAPVLPAAKEGTGTGLQPVLLRLAARPWSGVVATLKGLSCMLQSRGGLAPHFPPPT